MTDTKARELERRWQASGVLDDLVAWVAERIRAADPDLGEAELVQCMRQHPDSNELRRLYAEWLPGVDPAPCAAFLEAESALVAAPEDADAREAYHVARGQAPKPWLARMEQPSLMRACPLPLPSGWVSFGLGEFRPVGGTYGHADLATAPDLDPARVLDFAWLQGVDFPPDVGDVNAWRAAVEALQGRVAELGFTAPKELVTLLVEHLPRTSAIDSCTDCYFTLDFPPVRAVGGLVVPFYNDSQSCVTWGLWLHPSGAQAVVSFSLIWMDEEGEQELPEDVTAAIDDDGTRLGGFAFVSPSLEAFTYRTWIENELWYGLHDYPGRDLEDPELAGYLQHYRKD